MTSTSSSFYHFSIDDVFDSLIEVTDQKIPLFSHPFFHFLQKIHNAYGTEVELYVFYRKRIRRRLRTLKEVGNIHNQLSIQGANSWLHFGPHALDFETPPYVQSFKEQKKTFDLIYKEIDRFAGSDTHAQFVRLHYYSEIYELAQYFQQKGVHALLSTDREIGSYRMSERIKYELKEKGVASYKGMDFLRTQFRVEFFTNDKLHKNVLRSILSQTLLKYGWIILYTHECELKKKNIQSYIDASLTLLKQRSIPSFKNV